MRRQIFDKIQDFITHQRTHSVLFIDGARQVGKTYSVEAVLESIRIPHIKTNLEKNRILRDRIDKTKSFEELTLLLKDQLGFKADEPQVVFFDEAQESEKIGEYILSMKEDWCHKKVLITGSSLTRLFKKNQRVPVGRFARIKVSPFTFYEFLNYFNKDALIEAIDSFDFKKAPGETTHELLLQEFDCYLKVGGMPQVLEAIQNGDDYRTIRQDIIMSQREDFIRKTSIDDVELFDSCLKAIANHVGSPSRYTDVSSNYRNSKAIVSLLKKWNLILEVLREGIDPNKSDHLPKRYIYDMGVLHEYQSRPFQNISIIDATHAHLRTYFGGVLENAVLIELDAQQHSQGAVSTWKKDSQSQSEVDFVAERQSGFIPIECKAALKTTKWLFSNIINYLEISGEKKGYVVSPAPYCKMVHSSYELINLPVYLASRI